MKKRLQITLVVILAIVLVVAIGLALYGNSTTPPGTTQSGSQTSASPSSSGFGNPNLPASEQTTPITEVNPNPATHLSELEAIGINPDNIYKNNPDEGSRSDATIVQNNKYAIDYFAATNVFQLTLFAEPLADTQRAAEQDLLEQLKISQTQACRLSVLVMSQPTDLSKPMQQVDQKLSFCP